MELRREKLEVMCLMGREGERERCRHTPGRVGPGKRGRGCTGMLQRQTVNGRLSVSLNRVI